MNNFNVLIGPEITNDIFTCYLDVSQCCNTVTITSTGFAKTFHSAKLGTYIADGLSNGRLSYKNYEGAYLYFAPSNTWMVSIGICLSTLILTMHFSSMET